MSLDKKINTISIKIQNNDVKVAVLCLLLKKSLLNILKNIKKI